MAAYTRIDDTYGAAFVGVIVTSVLYGVTTLQTYLFYTYYPRDSIRTKLLVGLIWILDSAHTALVSIGLYHYLISNYGNRTALIFGHWAIFVSIAVNIVIAFLVHGFFTLQIFQLSSVKMRWWLVTIISLLVLAQVGFGIETVVFFFIKKRLDKLSEITLIAAMPFALSAVLSDVCIAVALCVLLRGGRRYLRSTKALVETLMVYAINRCVLTSVVAVVEVIMFAASPHSLWFLGIDFVVGKLYANSLLASLNSRHSLRNEGTMVQSVDMADINFAGESLSREDMNSKGVVIHLSPHQSISTGQRGSSDRYVGYEDKGKVLSKIEVDFIIPEEMHSERREGEEESGV